MSKQLIIALEKTIKNLNEKIGALRSNMPSELTSEQAKCLAEKIQCVIKMEINEAFRSVPISETTKLRRKLTLLLHPDKMRSALPELYAKLAVIHAQDCIYTLRDYPQQILNEMNSNNPFAYNFSARSDDSSSQSQEEDDPYIILQSWLEVVGRHLAQHHRYPEFLKNGINLFHAILDQILLGTYVIGIFLITLIIPFYELIFSFILAVGLQMGILYLYTGEMPIKDGFSFFTNISIICNLIAHLFTDNIVDPNWSTISLRILKILLAPVVLLAEIYKTLLQICGLALFFGPMVPVVTIKLIATIFFSFPFYLLDGYHYLEQIFRASSNTTPNERGFAEKLSRWGMYGSSSHNHESPRPASNDDCSEALGDITNPLQSNERTLKTIAF